MILIFQPYFIISREPDSFLQGTASAGVHDADDLSTVWNQNDHGIQFGIFKKENIHRHPGHNDANFTNSFGQNPFIFRF